MHALKREDFMNTGLCLFVLREDTHLRFLENGVARGIFGLMRGEIT